MCHNNLPIINQRLLGNFLYLSYYFIVMFINKVPIILVNNSFGDLPRATAGVSAPPARHLAARKRLRTQRTYLWENSHFADFLRLRRRGERAKFIFQQGRL